MTLTRDAFLGGRLTLTQPADGFRSGSDAVLLAAAVPARQGQTVLDLGCGAGAAMYCLDARVGGLNLTGVERDAAMADLSRGNGTAEVVTADVLALPPEMRNRQWGHVLANPPYFSHAAGSAADAPTREAGLREAAPGDLSRWVAVACKRVAAKGSVTFIARVDRLPDILTPMADALGAIVVLPVSSGLDAPAKRVIVQGIKGARAPLRLLPSLVLHVEDGSGAYRAEADSILRNAAALALR